MKLVVVVVGFWAILGVDPPQNQARNKRWLCVLIQLINRRLSNSYIVYMSMHKTAKDVQGQWTFRHNLSLFVCFFGVFISLY